MIVLFPALLVYAGASLQWFEGQVERYSAAESHCYVRIRVRNITLPSTDDAVLICEREEQ